MKKRLKIFGDSFYKAGYWTVMHDGIEHAGYLAFLGLLSLFPFLVFFVAIAGLLGETQLGIAFAHDVIGFIPEDMIAALKPRIEEIISGPPQGLMTIAVIGIIWTASSSIEGVRTILNRAYRVETPPSYLFRRLMSIGQFFILTAASIIAMFLLVLGPTIWREITQALQVDTDIIKPYWSYIRYGLSVSILYLVVATSYYVLPNIKQTIKSVAPGTFLVIAGWVGVAELLSMYIENFEQVNLVYGSLGGVIIALLFFYVVGIVYIFGAEFNYFYERALGHKFEVKKEVEHEYSL